MEFGKIPGAGLYRATWQGRTDLPLLLHHLLPIAREVREFTSTTPGGKLRFTARYLADGDLRELTYLHEAITSEEHTRLREHSGYLERYASSITFARYDSRQDDLTLWADISRTTPGTVGLIAPIIPDQLFKFFEKTRPTGFNASDISQLREQIQRHVQTSYA